MLTILEQVWLLTPYFIYSGIIFILLVANTIVTRVVVRRGWRREEEERLPEIVRHKLNERDKVIRSLRYHNEQKDKWLAEYSVSIRAANQLNHKVSEILQLPMVNETLKKRRAG